MDNGLSRHHYTDPSGLDLGFIVVDDHGSREKPRGHYVRESLMNDLSRDRRRPDYPNPPLILVHALNPPVPADVEAAWCKFHQKDRYTGTTRDIGKIAGAPDFTFALGRCEALEIDGKKCTFSKRPWSSALQRPVDLDRSPEPMNIGSGMADRRSALTYVRLERQDRTRCSGTVRQPAPSLDPIGRPAWCKAILLQGGRYKVTDWIHD
jgi:hypothetical protein